MIHRAWKPLLQGWALFMALMPVAASALDCVYPDRAASGSYVAHRACGEPDANGELKLTLAHRRKLVFDRYGLACVMAEGGPFMFRRDGRSRRMFAYDNGCDDFADGLARAYLGERPVYVDTALNVALQPDFAWLGRFESGFAVVCAEPITIDARDAEHPLLHSDHCGMIDRNGRLAMAAHFPLADTAVFRRFANSNNHCPVPPIASEAAAVCHARRHLAAESHPPVPAGMPQQVRREGEYWRVRFAGCDRFACNPEVLLDAGSADFIRIEPGKPRRR